MRPDISEFSYGYALTETLISTVPRRLKAAPVFPSLIEEGKTEDIFTNPREKRTQDYITGRIG